MPAQGMFGVTLPSFPDCRGVQGQQGTPLTNPGDFQSISTVETKLLANGYTQSTLNSMTVNDKIYALRLVEEAAGIH